MALLLKTGPSTVIPGHIYGRRQPSVIVLVGVNPLSDAAAIKACKRTVSSTWPAGLHRDMPCPLLDCDWSDGSQWLEALLSSFHLWMTWNGVPLIERHQWLSPVLDLSSENPTMTVLLPAASGLAGETLTAWRAFADWLNQCAEEPTRAKACFEDYTAGLRRAAPSREHAKFMSTALEMGHPALALGPNATQFGQGVYGQWFEGTFTSKVNVVGVRLARNKRLASENLREAGIPTPKHATAKSKSEAVTVAHQLGFPVVIKPLDADGGQGVTADIHNQEMLAKAFENASAVSDNILVEEHIPGNDYRLIVVNNECVFAAHRRAASVVGDGKSSIEQLIAKENASIHRSGPTANLKPIPVNESVIQHLHKQDLSLKSRLPKNKEIAVQSISNFNVGGRVIEVTDNVHPDNAALAVEAARVLQLDVAGVDLLISDISTSWRDVKAAVCEVNAHPNLFLALATSDQVCRTILTTTLGHNSRIPVIVVVGANDPKEWVKQISDTLSGIGLRTAWVTQGASGVYGQADRAMSASTFADSQTMLKRNDVDALVIAVNDDEILQLGFAVDKFDCCVLAGTNMQRKVDGGLAPPLEAMRFKNVLGAMLPACQTLVIGLEGAGIATKGMELIVPKTCQSVTIDQSQLDKTITDMLSKVNNGHGEAR